MAKTKCSIKGCNRTGRIRRTWCDVHYERWRAHGDPNTVRRQFKTGKCSIAGCNIRAVTRGWCHKHYVRWRAHGDPNTVLLHHGPNKIVRRNGIVRIQLIRRDGTILWAKVDAKDYDGLNLGRYRWHAQRDKNSHTFYVRTSIYKQRPKMLHRLILPNAPIVDHRNHNGLDNRRKNIRPATRSQNVSARLLIW